MVFGGPPDVLSQRCNGGRNHNGFDYVQDATGCCVCDRRNRDIHARDNHLLYGNNVTQIAVQGTSIVVRNGKIGIEQACCCGCSEDCCRTTTYSYMSTEPKGKWFDECPTVGTCSGEAGSCANAVLEGFIVERFCKPSVQGKQIKATLRKNSTIDDFGSVAGIETDEYTCGQLGKFTGDHDITEEIVFEDDPDDPSFLLAKVPFTATNANHGGPYGLASVRICWCCVEEGDPPCECCVEVCTDVYALSGGAGTTTNTYTFPSEALDLEFIWEAYFVPDAFTVKFCGDTVVDTGSVSGGGKSCLQKPDGCTSVEVTVVGPEGTAWGYTIKCSCGPPPPPRYGCRQGECVEMPGGLYGDPTCGGDCDTVGPCCTKYGLSYVKRSQCAAWQGTFYEPGEDFDPTCGCDCTIGGDYCITDSVPCGDPRPDAPTHCGPSPINGYEYDYYAFTRTNQGYATGYFCENNDCSPLDDLIAKGADITGWLDYASATNQEANSECCVGFATVTRYRYRVFALNCETKQWEEAPNVMAFANFDSSGNSDGAACTTGPAPVPPYPEATLRLGNPTCLPAPPNPLP